MSGRQTFNLGTEPGSAGSSLFLVSDGASWVLRRPAFRKPEAEIRLSIEQLRLIAELAGK